MAAQNPWTDERIEILKVLWNEGLSTSKIAEKLGGGFTRNAIIGKRVRLGLPERGKAIPVGDKRMRSRRHLAAARSQCSWQPSADAPRSAPVLRVAEQPKVGSVTFDELQPHHCRWPLGGHHDKPERFCGCEKLPGRSYCREHLERSIGRRVPAETPVPTFSWSIKKAAA